MQQKEAKELLKKYRKGICNDEEKAIVEDWILFGKTTYTPPAGSELEEDLDEMRSRLENDLQPRSSTNWRTRLAAAAMLLLVCAAGFYFLRNAPESQPEHGKQQAGNTDIGPGGNKAVITLPDGSKVSVDDRLNGEIAKQSGMVITKTPAGQVVYEVEDSPAGRSESGNNKIETPRGGQYQVLLPDGTRVWLNAVSSLTFPVAFNGKNRTVELTGEAYFEVAKNAAKPFLVVHNRQVVRVLGTHFNINAYADEPAITTSLLEGAVNVKSGDGKETLLRPGQQLLLYDHQTQVKEFDAAEVLAWKNGLFRFNNTDLKTMMRQISRWYDVTVRYEGEIAKQEFGGAIQRDLKLSEVFDILQKSKIHFKIEGREVIVMP